MNALSAERGVAMAIRGLQSIVRPLQCACQRMNRGGTRETPAGLRILIDQFEGIRQNGNHQRTARGWRGREDEGRFSDITDGYISSSTAIRRSRDARLHFKIGTLSIGGGCGKQQASLDFAFLAVGRVAVLAKQIIAHYYGKPADHSYFTGCSTGGREAMLMTQRYPTYFDGVVSGAPAMRTGYSGIGDEWVATMLNTVAPKDASGRANPRAALSDDQKKTVMDGLLRACDEADGLKDGMIFNTTACRFDPKTLVCDASKSAGCLTAAQADAIEKGFAGQRRRS